MAPALATQDIALFAISYDAIAILRDFAAAQGITFPLLSDEGSQVMRALGLINGRVLEDHAAYGIAPNPRFANLPYPGVFVLDGEGVVTAKVFHESYRERDSGGGLIAATLGIVGSPPAVATGTGPAITARAWLDSPTYAWFQRLTLTVEVTVAPGHHVYARPTSPGLAPLSAEVEPVDGLEVGAAIWLPKGPGPSRRGAELSRYEGTVRGTLPLTFAGAPGGGDHTLRVRVAFQACRDATALAPGVVELTVPVREVALVGRSLPAHPA